MPREEREYRRRVDRDIDTRKGKSLILIVGYDVIVCTTQGDSRKERSKKVGIRKGNPTRDGGG